MNNYRPEGAIISTYENREALSSLQGIEKAMQNGKILEGLAVMCDEELNLLETYVGPAIFEDELQVVGKEHLGGEKILAVNRTSSGILASILALVKEGSHVSHFLAEFPAHPSIPRSCNIVGASYDEFVDIDKFTKSSIVFKYFDANCMQISFKWNTFNCF